MPGLYREVRRELNESVRDQSAGGGVRGETKKDLRPNEYNGRLWLLKEVIQGQVLVDGDPKLRIYKPLKSKRRLDIPSPDCGKDQTTFLPN